MNPRMKGAAAFAIAVLAATGANAKDQDKDETVKVMVLGTYHMGNPGLDLHNAKVDDVTSEKRQKELADVATRLAKFKPTKIALEGMPTRADFVSEKYPAFKPEDLKEKRDERIQIGYRLAYNLGHKNVYLIDEQSDTIDYFPYGAVAAYAEEKGRNADLEAANAEVGAMIKAFEEKQQTMTVAELLADANTAEASIKGHDDFYYGLLKLDGPDKQPAAELNAYWYMRNAKIFAKLMQVAEPGDRIVVLYGSGHNYWLRHFAEHTPGFELVEPNGYLLKR